MQIIYKVGGGALVVGILGVLLTFPAMAQMEAAPAALPPHAASAAPGAPSSDASEQTPAAQFVQGIGNKAIAIIANKSLTSDQRTQQYDDILRQAFDIQTIGKFVLGRAWKTASPDQQQEFMKLFEALLLKTYGDRLTFYNGENFRVKGERQENDQDYVVNSEITHPDGSKATSVDWRVLNENGKLAIVDVVIEGVSQSVTQRQEYASIIEQNGGKIDGLLTMMRQRLQENPANSPSDGHG